MSSIEVSKRKLLYDLSTTVEEYNIEQIKICDMDLKLGFRDTNSKPNKVDYKTRKLAERFIKNLPDSFDMVALPKIYVTQSSIFLYWSNANIDDFIGRPTYELRIDEKCVQVKSGRRKKNIIIPKGEIRGKYKEALNNFFLDLSIDLL